MAENSSIEWTDHTWNPWIGCQKLSPACDHCYAERDAPARVLRARGIETWGPHGQRVRTGEENWKLPGRWNRRAAVAAAGWADGVKLYGSEEAALAAGHLKPHRPRVFCLSQGDWLDNAVPAERLADMLDVVRMTPALDWLLLTKRIGAWHSRIASAIALAGISEGRARWPELSEWLVDWVDGRAPAHVWIGATVATQAEADRDIPKLLGVPAAVRFLSIEPMLGPIDLGLHRIDGDAVDPVCDDCGDRHEGRCLDGLHWVICGGESGPGARPMHPDWARSLLQQCKAAGVPFLFKQWGEYAYSPITRAEDRAHICAIDSDGGDWAVSIRDGKVSHHGPKALWWTPDQETLPRDDLVEWTFIGKKAAGRLLDGQTHDGYPEVAR